jgi:hypothetical protein
MTKLITEKIESDSKPKASASTLTKEQKDELLQNKINAVIKARQAENDELKARNMRAAIQGAIEKEEIDKAAHLARK